MIRRTFSLVNGCFQLDDSPGAAKVVVVPGPVAQRLADLQLHQQDLQQVLEWGEALGRVTPELDPAPQFTIRRGLWYAMVVRFCKCFDTSAGRFRLDSRRIYQGDQPALENYQYFSHLRDKHLVHDENGWWQAYTLAILNHLGQESKVADVLCFGVLQESFCINDMSKLEPLVKRAAQWVSSAFDELSACIKTDLEKRPYDELAALGGINYVLPADGDAMTPKPRA